MVPCWLLALLVVGYCGLSNGNTCDQSFQCPTDSFGNCETGNYADRCNCQWYWHCQECNQYHLSCPIGELFDDDTGQCEPANLVYCWPTTNPMPSTITIGITTQTTQPVIPLIFSVARNQDLQEAQIIMKFEHVYCNQGLYYNLLTGLMQAPRGGYIFQSMSAGAIPFAPINMNIREGAANWLDLYSSTTNRNGTTTICRNFIHESNRNEIYAINMAPNSEVASNPMRRHTSWSAFDYQQIMEPSMAFAAGTRNPANHTGTIKWDQVNSNLHSYYNSSTGVLTIADTGIYFVSVTVGKAAHNPVRVSLRTERQGDVFTVNSTGDLDNGVDMAMNAMLLLFVSGESVFVTDDYGLYYSDFEMQTSWNMILYRPKFTGLVAFTVFSYQDFNRQGQPGLNPFPFHEAKINTQWDEVPVYNFSKGHFYAPLDGYYFLYLNAFTWEGIACDMEIHNDGLFRYDIAGINWDVATDGDDGGVNIGRGVIIQIASDEETWIELGQNSAVRGTDGIGTSWTGFLLYPI